MGIMNLDEEIMRVLGLKKVEPVQDHPHIVILNADPPARNPDSEKLRDLVKRHTPPLIVFRDGGL